MSQNQNLRVQLKLTDRGWKALACSVLLGLLGFLFMDLILVGSASLLAILLVYTVLRMRHTIRNLCSLVVLQPDGFESSLTAGESFHATVKVESSVGVQLRFTSPLEEGLFESCELGIEDSRVVFVFRPQLSDEYSSEELRVGVVDRFGLVGGEGGVPFHLDFRVYPRVLAAAVEAARFLLAAGGLGVGEQPTKLKGSGLEYAGSREYVAGDTLRHMDWKATARLNRLVMKEFYIEGGTGVHLAYEAVAPDPVSVDQLSTAFLSTALALARQDLPLGLTVHDGESVWLHVRRVQPALAVGLALQYALKAVEADAEQLYTIVEPKTASELRGILQQLDQTPLRQLLQAELKAVKNRSTEPCKVLQQLLGMGGERVQLILATSLTSNPLPILELANRAQRKGCPLIILQPTKPWLTASSLGEAYRLYERYRRLNKTLYSHRIPVAPSAEKLSRHISAAQILTRITG